MKTSLGWFIPACLALLWASDVQAANPSDTCGICTDCQTWFPVRPSCCNGESPSCQGLACCGPVNDNYKYSANNCLAFPGCSNSQLLCCSDKRSSCCDGSSSGNPCCNNPSPNYRWKVDSAIAGLADANVTFDLLMFDLMKQFTPNGVLYQTIIELPSGWDFSVNTQCFASFQRGSTISPRQLVKCSRSTNSSSSNSTSSNTPPSIMFYDLQDYFKKIADFQDPSIRITLEMQRVKTPSIPTVSEIQRFWLLNDSFTLKSEYQTPAVYAARPTSSFLYTKSVYTYARTEGILQFKTKSGLEPNSELKFTFLDGKFAISQNTTWSLQDSSDMIVACRTTGGYPKDCNATVSSSIPSNSDVKIVIKNIINANTSHMGTTMVMEGLFANSTVISPALVMGSAILPNDNRVKPPSSFSVVSVVIYSVCFVICVSLSWANGLQLAKPKWLDITATVAILNFVTLIISNALWLSSPTVIYSNIAAISQCLVWTMIISVCFDWATGFFSVTDKLSRTQVILLFLTLIFSFYAFVIWGVIETQDFQSDFLTSRMTCSSDVCGIGTSAFHSSVYADAQPSESFSYKDSSLPLLINSITYALFTVATLVILWLGVVIYKRGDMLESRIDDALKKHQLKKTLRMFQIAIGLVVSAYLISNSMHLFLWSANIKYQWWYIFAVWLPTAVPPCCFLVLQWNAGVSTLKKMSCSPASPMSSIVEFQNSVDMYNDMGTPSVSTTNDKSVWRAASLMEDDVSASEGTQSSTNDKKSTIMRKGGGISALQYCISLTVELPYHPAEGRGIYVVCLAQSPNSSFRGNELQKEPTIEAWKESGSTETVTILEDSNGRAHAHFRSLIEVMGSAFTEFGIKFRVLETSQPIEDRDSSNAGYEDGARLIEGHGFEEEDDEHGDTDIERDSSQQDVLLCEFSTTASEVASAGRMKVPIRIEARYGRGSEAPLLESQEFAVLVANPMVTQRRLRAGIDHTIQKTLEYRSVDGTPYLAQETLTESPFSNDIPRQILEILIRQRSRDYMRAKNDLTNFSVYFTKKVNEDFHGGIYETLIDHIQENGDLSSIRAWLEERVEKRKAYVKLLKKGWRVCMSREKKDELFKASVYKKDKKLRFLPINLQHQVITVGPKEYFHERDLVSELGSYDFVTVGAMAAHVYKFKNGGLLKLMHQAAKFQGKELSPTDRDWTEEHQRRDDLQWDITERLDVCLTQATTAAVQCFVGKLDHALRHTDPDIGEALLRQWGSIGFALQVESLLSTHGKEVGMIEDMAGAIAELSKVKFLIQEETSSPPAMSPSTESTALRHSSTGDDETEPGVVSVEVFQNYEEFVKETGHKGEIVGPGFGFKRNAGNSRGNDSYVILFKVRTHIVRLPKRWPRVKVINVVSMIFTQGINEMQTIANSTNSSLTEVQDNINGTNLQKLNDYAATLFRFIETDPKAVTSSPPSALKDWLTKLNSVYYATRYKKTKATEVLQTASDFCREANVGRITVCKSAKDRTSMSVTLEEGRILVRHQKHPPHSVDETVATLRSKGVRLENAFKNTGKRFYAFNALQRKMLPSEYRCPPGTGGQNKS